MKKRTKKKINSILAIFMSLAIIASGFGTPMAGLVAAAGENSAQQTEKTVEKTSVEKVPEQTGAKDETKSEGDNVDRTKPDSPNSSAEEKPATAPKIKKASSKEKKADKDDWSKGPNPDHMKGPEKPCRVPINHGIYPATKFGMDGQNMRMARSRANNPPIIGVDHPENPGDVMLFKEVKKVEGMVNTFDVTLRMEAKDSKKKSDIVLVMDRSGSMNDNGRMTKAKEAANKFVDNLLPSSTTRISVVSFASNVTTDQPLTTNKTDLHYAINHLSAYGGTFTQAGIKQAEAILANSNADFKHIVLLSDGQPTYSYEIPNKAIRRAGYYISNGKYFTGSGYSNSAFGTNRVGTGNSLYSYIEKYNGKSAYYHNGNSTINEAGFAKSAGQSVWTIALEAGPEGTPILNSVASPGQSYTATPAELNTIFGEIAGKISAAMQNAHVSDPMGTGFQIPVGEVSNIQATPSTPAPSYNASTHTLTWNPGTINTPIAPNSDIKYAELKYRVDISDLILSIQPPPTNGEYNTNGNAQVNYTDINGNSQTTSFPKPVAKPIIVEMKKVFLDSAGNPIPSSDDRKFNFNLKLQDDSAFNQDYEVKGNSSRIMTDLRIDKLYNLTENRVTGTHPGNLSDYDTTISWKTWDGAQQSQSTVSGNTFTGFKIPRDTGNGDPLNTTITVTNKEKADGKLTLKKTFKPTVSKNRGVYGVKSALYRAAPEYTITVVGKSPYSNEEIYREEHKLRAGETKEITGLRYGKYIVTEDHDPAPTFVDSDGTNDGKVDIRIDGKEASVEVINRPKDVDYETEVTAKKKWVNGPTSDHTAPPF
mgnify:CR=1 FL=1